MWRQRQERTRCIIRIEIILVGENKALEIGDGSGYSWRLENVKDDEVFYRIF